MTLFITIATPTVVRAAAKHVATASRTRRAPLGLRGPTLARTKNIYTARESLKKRPLTLLIRLGITFASSSLMLYRERMCTHKTQRLTRGSENGVERFRSRSRERQRVNFVILDCRDSHTQCSTQSLSFLFDSCARVCVSYRASKENSPCMKRKLTAKSNSV